MFREMSILETVLLSERVSFLQLNARIAHSRHLRRVTNYNNALSLICQLAENVHYLLLCVTVKVAGRLIRQNHLRVIRQCSGDGYTLLLTAGKLQHTPVGLLGSKTDACKQGLCPFPAAFSFNSGDVHGEQDVFCGCELGD